MAIIYAVFFEPGTHIDHSRLRVEDLHHRTNLYLSNVSINHINPCNERN